jgi:hypothetical protein
METVLFDLHILLSGPFVLRQDDDCFRILIPDLMDTHYKPGFTASNNSAELDNGVWTVSFDKMKKRNPRDPVKTAGTPLDMFCWPRTQNSSAFATVKLSIPDCVHGLSPADAEISSDTETLGNPQNYTYATRAALIYESVDLSTVKISPPLAWHSPQNGPDLVPLGAAAQLVLDMQPLQVPTSEDHAMMAYRNMAKMVGVNRFMRQGSAMRSGNSLDRAKYNDCGAALMLVSPPKPLRPE